MFCCGTWKWRSAATNSGQFWARFMPISAWAVVSFGSSAVQAMASTKGPEAISAACLETSEITGPCRVRRTSSITGSASLTLITSRRTSKGRGPSGVR